MCNIETRICLQCVSTQDGHIIYCPSARTIGAVCSDPKYAQQLKTRISRCLDCSNEEDAELKQKIADMKAAGVDFEERPTRSTKGKEPQYPQHAQQAQQQLTATAPSFVPTAQQAYAPSQGFWPQQGGRGCQSSFVLTNPLASSQGSGSPTPPYDLRTGFYLRAPGQNETREEYQRFCEASGGSGATAAVYWDYVMRSRMGMVWQNQSY